MKLGILTLVIELLHSNLQRSSYWGQLCTLFATCIQCAAHHIPKGMFTFLGYCTCILCLLSVFSVIVVRCCTLLFQYLFFLLYATSFSASKLLGASSTGGATISFSITVAVSGIVAISGVAAAELAIVSLSLSTVSPIPDS